MIIKASLLFDLGNSETRCILLSGVHGFRFNLSNKFAQLPEGYRIPRKYVNEKSTVMEFGKLYFANGSIVEREFVGKELRPTAMQSKTEQLNTDLTLRLGMYKAMQILAMAYSQPITSLDVSFAISVLLPPEDQDRHEEAMINKIRGIGNVVTHVPVSLNLTFRVVPEEVNVFGEAIAAFFGAFYYEKGQKPMPQNEGKSLSRGDVLVFDNGPTVELAEVPENKTYETGYSLVLDIGAGTTDLALFKDLELVDNSIRTIKLGGNTVESNARTEVIRTQGFAPADMKRVMLNGILDEGDSKHDVSKEVTLAKQAYTQQMMGHVRTYLEGMAIEMRMIKGLLAAGGGSLPSKIYLVNGVACGEGEVKPGMIAEEKIVSPPMAEVLINFLNELAPKMKLMSTEGKSQRELNIMGLLYLHKYA